MAQCSLKYHVEFTKPPKEKRLIVVGFNQQNVFFAAVLINSQINPNIFPSAALQALHLEFEVDNRPYLDHNSFVDCSQIHQQRLDSVLQMLTAVPNAHLGHLESSDLEKVLETLRNAPTIPVYTKKEFGLAP